MRSRHALKITTVLVALSLQIAPAQAQAGYWNQLIEIFVGKGKVAKVEPQAKIETSVEITNKVTVEPSPVIIPPAEPTSEEKFVKSIQEKFGYASTYQDLMHFEIKLADQIQNERHSEIKISYSDSGMIVQFNIDKEAAQNPRLALKNLLLISYILDANIIPGLHLSNVENLNNNQKPGFFMRTVELLRNVEAGSPTALAQLRKIELNLLQRVSIMSSFVNADEAKAYQKNQIEMLSTELAVLEEAAIKHLKAQQKKLDKWKTETKTLDTLETMEQKLEALLINNDRKGVAELIRAYLPWAVMEPMEAGAWKVWLQAIENPDWTKTTVAFRGLDYTTDKIQRKQTANGEIYGFMSTILTKNQGNYNRRLRSLSTNRISNGDANSGKDADFKSIRISDQMYAHSLEPKASSFLSFTYDPTTARIFIGPDKSKIVNGSVQNSPNGGLLVVKMDSRRLVPNIASKYDHEIELLAPLIVFPDEVVKYHEGTFRGAGTFDQFKAEISAKTGINFSKWQQARVEDNLDLTEVYRRDGLKFFGQVFEKISNARAANYCGKALL